MRKAILTRIGALGVVALGAGLLVPVSAAAAPSAVPTSFSHLDASQAASLAARATRPVIVMFKDQVGSLSASPTQSAMRKSAVASVQAPVVDELQQLKAPNLRTYSLINAVSATVSPAEEARLARDSAVSAVLPDQTAQLNFDAPSTTNAPQSSSSPSSSSSPTSACQVGSGGVELDPQALPVIRADSNLPGSGPTAASLGITGAGVKVAFIAEGFQVDQPNFIRANGSKVVIDEKDFTGEGIGNASGGEASLDASSIAAQGNVKYTAQLSNGKSCTFTVRGAAPGASVVGLKIFSNNYLATTTSILEAIDYAVTTDHVNVLNESFGYNPLPDTMTDVVRQADEAAVQAGTVVDVSTGDGGPTSTVGSPSTDPAVLAAGASTTYRVYAQEQIATAGSFKGWEDNNLSSLSGGGMTEGLNGPDLLAPGDLNWDSCNPAPHEFGACISGGTSESAPLTSGVAALVIQAYRKTHGGATPTPAVVKQIITSTTTDLGLPADQQGTGLLNAYQAVLAAESIKTPDGSPTPTGMTLLTSTHDITATAPVDTTVTSAVSVTNAGHGAQTVTLAGRILSSPTALVSATIRGAANVVQKKVTFNVAPGTAYLAAHAAVTSTALGSSFLNIDLVDPLGRLAIDGLPQGDTLTSNVGVRYPDAGRWSAYVTYEGSSPPSSAIAFDATAQTWQPFGTVTPSSVTVAAGATATFTVAVTTPPVAGDESAALQLSSPFAPSTSIPIALRSLVTLSGGSGSFSAPVFGGNGRGGAPSSTQYFAVDVPQGQPELNVSTTFTNGPATNYTLMLISPSGEAVGHASNQLMVGGTTVNPVTTTEAGAASHVVDPAPGRWTIIVAFANLSSGTKTSAALSGAIDLSPATVSAKGLPESGTLPVGSQTVVVVRVKNSTDAPQAYFLDPRLDATVDKTLKPYASTAAVTLPLGDTASVPQWIVPTDTTALFGQVDATAPVTFDMSPYLGNFGGELNGDPQVTASSTGDSATASWSDNPVTPGDWNLDPALLGVFGKKGVAPAQANLTLQATTLGFDGSISTSYGDLWKGNTTLHPVIVRPGATTTLYAVIDPSHQGTVSGTLYLDTTGEISPYGNAIPVGDQVAALPYTYTAVTGN